MAKETLINGENPGLEEKMKSVKLSAHDAALEFASEFDTNDGFDIEKSIIASTPSRGKAPQSKVNTTLQHNR
jgi:hypothetical protein